MNTTLKKRFIPVLLSALVLALSCFVFAGCSSEPKTSEVTFNIDAPGWSDDSTVAIAHLTKANDDNSDNGEVDVYQTFTPSDNGSTVELDNGKYTIEWIAPINADRTTYEAVEPQTITVEPDAHVDVVFTAVPAEQMTAEKLDTALSEITNAKDNSNGAISDDVVTRATELVDAAKAAIAAEEQAKAEAEAKAQAEAEAAAAETAAQSNNSGSYSGTKSSGGNGGGSSTPSYSGGGGGGSHVSDSDWDRYIKNSTDTVNEAHHNGESVSTANPGGSRSADD